MTDEIKMYLEKALVLCALCGNERNPFNLVPRDHPITFIMQGTLIQNGLTAKQVGQMFDAQTTQDLGETISGILESA